MTVRRLHRGAVEQLDRLRYAHQRVARGYDDVALFNADGWLGTVLGGLLVELSQRMVSYPPETTPEAWGAALREHGEALVTYGRLAWEDPNPLADAQLAMHWVADNLPWLWD